MQLQSEKRRTEEKFAYKSITIQNKIMWPVAGTINLLILNCWKENTDFTLIGRNPLRQVSSRKTEEVRRQERQAKCPRKNAIAFSIWTVIQTVNLPVDASLFLSPKAKLQLTPADCATLSSIKLLKGAQPVPRGKSPWIGWIFYMIQTTWIINSSQKSLRRRPAEQEISKVL